MYSAEPDVRVLRKNSLKSYLADTYTEAKIWRGTFDENDSFLDIFLMERKRVRPAGRQYGT